MKTYTIYKGGRRVAICEGEVELYHFAYEQSLKHRSAVYFGEDATDDELIDDLNGIGFDVDVDIDWEDEE